MKKFNVKPTADAYAINRHKFDKLSQDVNDAILYGDYPTVYNNLLWDCIEHVSRVDGEILKLTFEGMLEDMIPNPLKQNPEARYTDAELRKAISIGAQVLVNVLVDSGEFQQNVQRLPLEVKPGQKPEFITKTTLVFSNVPKDKSKLYGIETKSGVCYQKRIGTTKLKSKHKGFLKTASSFAYKLSDVATYELLTKCLSFSKDYNAKPKKGDVKRRESGTKKRERKCKDIAIGIEKLTELGKFFLPMQYDTRGRMYYLFQLEGFRPQGKAWEVSMIDAAVPKVLDLSAIPHLKHIIYVAKNGRASLTDALANWTDELMEWAENVDPMSIEVKMPYNDKTKHHFALAEHKIGDYITIMKAVKCIKQTLNREPTHYLFGKDLTNSGLMMAGSNFKSAKMITSSNLSLSSIVYDSHSDMQVCYGLEDLSRKDMKKISNPMFHGASPMSLVKNVQSALVKNGVDEHTVNSIDLEFVTQANYKAFGAEVDNIYAISSWGRKAVNNYRTKLFWTTPDGFQAHHVAHIEHCPVRFKVATCDTKSGFREVTITRNMPVSYTSKGKRYVTKDFKAPVDAHDPTYKDMGYYANLTHSFDATLARRVADNVYAKGEPCLLKHDDYIMFADNFDDSISIVGAFFKEANVSNFYQKALEDSYIPGSDMPLIPELIIGDGVVEDSVNMLMP